MNLNDEDIGRYLAGEALVGDDLDLEGIEEWYSAEEAAYREMKQARVSSGVVPDGHQYDAVNRRLGFGRLPAGPIGEVLAVGGYDGSEFRPVWPRLESLTVLDPAFPGPPEIVDGVTLRRVAPQPSGTMEFEDASFDLVTSFSVLHHIPNVTHVLAEMVRVLRPGGHLIVREPISTMGDWTRPRPGLTPNERGLPLAWLRSRLSGLPVEVLHEDLYRHPLTAVLPQRLGLRSPYNVGPLVSLDLLLSRMTRWNVRYYRPSRRHKLAPGAVFVVARKGPGGDFRVS